MKSVFQQLKEQRLKKSKAVLVKNTPKDVLEPAQGNQKVMNEKQTAVNVEVNNQNLADSVETQPITQEEVKQVQPTKTTFAPKDQQVDYSMTNEHLENKQEAEAPVESEPLRGVNDPNPVTQSNEASQLEPVVPDAGAEQALGRDIAPIVDEYAPTLMGITNRISNVLPVGAFLTGNPVTAGVLLGGAVLAPVVVAGAIQIARKVEQVIEEGQTQVKNVQKEYKNVFHKK